MFGRDSLSAEWAVLVRNQLFAERVNVPWPDSALCREEHEQLAVLDRYNTLALRWMRGPDRGFAGPTEFAIRSADAMECLQTGRDAASGCS